MDTAWKATAFYPRGAPTILTLSTKGLHRFGWQENVAAANRATCVRAAAAAVVASLYSSYERVLQGGGCGGQAEDDEEGVMGGRT